MSNHSKRKRVALHPTAATRATAESRLETPTVILCDDIRDRPKTPTVKVDQVDLFFRRQADVFWQYKTNLPLVRAS
jgi:hypothetical protein